MPITWRNVAGPDFSASNRLLAQGQQGMSQGLSQLASVADQQAQTNKEDLALDKAKNTESILGRIAGLGSMDEYKSAINAGTFDPSNLPENVDTAAIRTALQGKDNKIMQQSSDDFKYQQQMDTQNDNPLLTEFNKTLLHTKGDGYAALVAGLDKSGMSETGQLKAMQAIKQQKTSEEAIKVAQAKADRSEKAAEREENAASMADKERLANEANKVATTQAKLTTERDTQQATSALERVKQDYPFNTIVSSLDSAVSVGGAIDGFIDKHYPKGEQTPDDDAGMRDAIKGVIKSNKNNFDLKIPEVDADGKKTGEFRTQHVDMSTMDTRILQASLKEIGVDDHWLWGDDITSGLLPAIKKNAALYYNELDNQNYVRKQEKVYQQRLYDIGMAEANTNATNLASRLNK